MSKKIISIIGGSGYVGTAISKHALSLGIKVFSISRTSRQTISNLDNIEYIKGDSMNPDTFEKYLRQSHAVVHTIGTLIDTSITKRATPGSLGTYEQMNRDSAINIAKTLQSFNKKTRMVYLSASGHPPFIPRYLSTKKEAEEFIFSQKNIEGVILKPGFIYNKKEKNWSMPLSSMIDLYSKISSPLLNSVPNSFGRIKNIMNNFYVDESIGLDDVAWSAIFSCFEKDFYNKSLKNQY